jgi:hypothetical protein
MDHEVFAKLVYNALNAYQLEVWLRMLTTALESTGRSHDLLIQLKHRSRPFVI